MSDEKALMASIAPFGLRMQPDLKERIAQYARDNNRSMNAEIIDRLERSESLFAKDLREWASMLQDSPALSEQVRVFAPALLSDQQRVPTLQEQIDRLERRMSEFATQQEKLIHLLESKLV